MNVPSFKPRLLGSSMLIAAAIALGATVPALADSTVVTTVGPGTFTASMAGATVGTSGAVSYSQAPQNATGAMTLSVDDSRGTTNANAAGWSVTVQSSSFAYSGTSINQLAIPAANLGLVSDAGITQVVDNLTNPVGQPIDLSGPINPYTTGDFGAARTVLGAPAGHGNGAYTQVLNLSLSVPAYSRPGTYTGTITTTIASAL